MTIATETLTIEQTDEARNGLPARWTIKQDGHLIGLIERYRKNALHDNAYRASYLTPNRSLQHFENFRGTNGLQAAAEAIASKAVV
jgi:hypothetical protein